MRLFEALNSEHLVLYFWPTLAFVVVFAIGLAFMHVRRRDSDERLTRIIEEYPGGIQGRNAPFPLIVTLTIAATIAWGLLYIVLTGLLKVRI
jgi:hypothetical protein